MDNIILLVLRFCWVIAFDADVALMDKIDYELIEGYLNVVSNWVNKIGLTINPSKTEILYPWEKAKHWRESKKGIRCLILQWNSYWEEV